MKFKWDKKYLYWGVTAFIVLAAAIIFYMVLSEETGVGDFLSFLLSAFAPVLLGFVFAYLLNPLVKLLHFKFLDNWGLKIYKGDETKAKKFGHIISMVVTAILVLAFFIALLYIVIPKLYKSIESIVENLSTYYGEVKDWLTGLFRGSPDMQQRIEEAFNNAADSVQSWFKNGFLDQLSTIVDTLFSSVVTVVKSFINVIVGFIIAIYLLAEKDRFIAQAKKVMYSIFSTERATRYLIRLKDINRIFIGFISGKVIDSIMIGIVCYILMLIFRIPNAELVSVIVGVTNIIPFFGPYLGAIPSALLILLDDPLKALIFIIIIIVIQQIDANIIAPQILGESTGLSGLWVLCSLMIFGGLFGFIGMLIGVPTFAVIYSIIKSSITAKLKKKNIPWATTDFKEIDYIDPATNKPVKKNTEEESIRKKEKRCFFRKKKK